MLQKTHPIILYHYKALSTFISHHIVAVVSLAKSTANCEPDNLAVSHQPSSYSQAAMCISPMMADSGHPGHHKNQEKGRHAADADGGISNSAGNHRYSRSSAIWHIQFWISRVQSIELGIWISGPCDILSTLCCPSSIHYNWHSSLAQATNAIS